ncbi:MAG: alpha/beta hydrolase [Candidatus Micrarchaeota archaeon]|nr:alpha/beta hydrolase [Candidatus Micrarchaeota archaeon]
MLLMGGANPNYKVESYNASKLTTDYRNSINISWVPINGLLAALPTTTPVGMGFENSPRRMALYSLANSTMYIASNITYCTYRGQPLLMDLYADRPLGPSDMSNGTRPIALYIFGGGFTSGNKTRFNGDMSPLILSLVGRGFVVASINYLLAPDYPYPNQTDDVLCAMRFLRYYSYSFDGDQNHIGTFGNSVGGQLSGLAAVLNGTAPWQNPPDLVMHGNLTHGEYESIPSRPYAAVDYYGSENMPSSKFILDLINKSTPDLATIFSQAFRLNTTIISWADGVDFVVRGEPPIMVVQGNNDTLTQESQSVSFYNKLKAYGNDNAELIIVYNGDHELIPNPPNSTIHPSLANITNATASFFISHLSSTSMLSAPAPQIVITPTVGTGGSPGSSENASAMAAALAYCKKAGVPESQCQDYCKSEPTHCGFTGQASNGSGSDHATTIAVNVIQQNSDQAAQYTKLYVGQSTRYNNFVIGLSAVTSINGQPAAVLNISTNFNFSRTIGQRQYSNIGAFYLAVNQINSTANPAWATVGEPVTIPNGFSNSTFNNYNPANSSA